MISKGKKRNLAVKGNGKAKGKVARVTTLKKKKLPATIATISVWEYSIKTGKMKWSALTGVGPFDGYAPENLKKLLASIASEDRQSVKTAFNNAVRTNDNIHLEVRILSESGNQWVEFNGSPVGGKTGVVKYRGTARDISRRKRNEIELSNWRIKNELISESAGLLIYDYNIDTGRIDWNGAVSQILGLTEADLNTIDKWESLIHPEDRAVTYEQLERTRIELRPYDIQYRFRTSFGDYRHIHDRGLYIVNESGQAHRMIGIMNDITAQVEAMNSVAASERSYRELFNSVGEAIYIQDINGVFLDVNNEACTMYGYAKAELIGKTPAFFSAPGKNDLEKLNRQLALAMNGEQQTFRWWGRKKGGEIILNEVRFTRGTHLGKEAVIATAWDITEKTKTASSLQESEKRFERMIEDLNVGVVLLSVKSELLTVNRAAQQILLLETGDNKIADRISFVTENGEPLSKEMLPWEVAQRTRVAVRGQFIGIVYPDEKTSWFLVNADPGMHDQDLVHIVITLTDITERKLMEEHWKESELRFRTLQEASFGGIGLHRMGALVDCNQGLCDLTGYRYEELIGTNGINLIAPEFRDLVIEKIISKSTQPYDVVGLRKDGSRFFLEIHGKNIPYKDGQLRVTEFRDITDRKLAEEKILEQNARLLLITEDLKQKNDQLQEFTQIVSHNLRSPVGNILALLSLIENARDDEERNDAVALLKEAGTTTLTTLTELNQVLQIQQNKNIERQILQFSDVFGSVKSLLNAKIAEAGAIVRSDFDAAPTVSFPKIYLESILLNLLSNALKYRYPGRAPEIMVKTVTNVDGSISMLVSDNGAGLNMKKYGHQVFKLRKTFHKHPESRGIGLFMIKNQIEAMGGKISLSSIENEGSVFQVDFIKTPNNEQ